MKKAVVVSLSDDCSEIIDLADTLGYKVEKEIIQHRNKPDVNSYIGPGKLIEIKEYIDKTDSIIHLVIVDGELKPSQWFTLEKKLEVDVYDRVRLILAIFEQRAERKEAKLQVKLAQLQYERPFVRELIHRARSGEHPGLMAGGEYQVDDYYEMIKKQMKKIKKNLEKIREQRKGRRQHRHKSGFYLVSLAGYTNAGKSSLLNLLSSEKVAVENRLFSTLSTTSRKINDKTPPILLTDTVGFIKDLPAWVIDAFHSTLEEIQVADLVLMILDISEKTPIVIEKLNISMRELTELGVKSSIIIVLNKIDLLNSEILNERLNAIKNNKISEDKKIICISIKSKKNINSLLDLIFNTLPNLEKIRLTLPNNKKTVSFISWLYDIGKVSDIKYGRNIVLNISINSNLKGKVISECKKLNGQISD